MVIKLLFCDWLNSCKLSVYSILVIGSGQHKLKTGIRSNSLANWYN